MEETKHSQAINDDARPGNVGRGTGRDTGGTGSGTAGSTARDSARAGTFVGLHTNPDATSHDLLNEATEWLQYAYAMTSMLSEIVSAADVENIVSHPRLAAALDGIGAMTNLGMLCAAEAHTRMCWEQAMAQRVVPRTR